MYHKLFHIAEHSCLRLCYSLLYCATCTHRLCHIHHSLLDCATFTPRLCDMHSSPVPHLLYDCATFLPRLCHIHSSTVPHSLVDCATFTPRLCHIHSSTVPHSLLDCAALFRPGIRTGRFVDNLLEHEPAAAGDDPALDDPTLQLFSVHRQRLHILTLRHKSEKQKPVSRFNPSQSNNL